MILRLLICNQTLGCEALDKHCFHIVKLVTTLIKVYANDDSFTNNILEQLAIKGLMTCKLHICGIFYTAANIFLRVLGTFFCIFKTKFLLLIKQQSEWIVVRFRTFHQLGTKKRRNNNSLEFYFSSKVADISALLWHVELCSIPVEIVSGKCVLVT